MDPRGRTGDAQPARGGLEQRGALPRVPPEPPTPEKALKTAVREAQAGQQEHLIRLGKDGDGELVFAVVQERRDQAGNVSYQQEARIVLRRLVGLRLDSDVPQHELVRAVEEATTPEDLLILTDSLWREPRERPKVARLVGELADPVSAKAAEILDAARETAARVAGLRSSDRKAYISNAAQALDEFRAQQAKLTELTRSAGPRAKGTLADATQEIGQLHADLARSVTSGLGLGGLR